MTARITSALVAIWVLFLASPALAEDLLARADEQTIKLPDFTFHTGEKLPSITMHVYTLGTARRDGDGRIVNAVMLLHGTGGDGTSLLRPSFGDELFGPGQPLDLARYYVISPDNLGHGASSKPSDGLRAAFPHYDYLDMVRAQHRMLTEGLGIDRLTLIIGTSMGCMHSFVWGPEYPDFVERYMPLACNAIEIAGRNRLFRTMIIEGFRNDPAYEGGNYRNPADLVLGQAIYRTTLLIARGNPYRMQAELPTREAVEKQYQVDVGQFTARPADPNDTIYQFDASRNYNPEPFLERITSPVLWINSADDFINPEGLGDPAALAARMPNARFVLIPASSDTYGHGTHSHARFWKDELVRFLADNP